jgi:flagellar biosynthesis chaperone FliJ
MPSFHFRLEPLLEKKKEDQESAEAALTSRRKELEAEQNALKNLERQAEQFTQILDEKRRQVWANGLSSGESLAKQNAFLLGLTDDLISVRAGIMSQKLIVSRADKAVLEATEFVAACRREVDILSKYRDKIESRFRREVARQEELESDEIGNVLYVTRGRKL